MVQVTPWGWALGGFAALFVVGLLMPLSLTGWALGVAYLIVSSLLVSLGLGRRSATRFGPANVVTATRSMLVGVATAMVVASFTMPLPTALFVTIVAVALALDAVDGFVARRTGTTSELGARFDMEVDAFLLLVLCVYDARYVGWLVLAIGLMRYAFVAVGWLLPWMRATLPPRYWRKVVTAFCGIALTIVAARILPPLFDGIIAAAALLLLIESFGRDVVWLIRANVSARSVDEPRRALPRVTGKGLRTGGETESE
ncbi:CDP-alcohol phosphatidyltransferase family protein [Planctomonas sp. JC2975]|uniref:CDP-alcohol phosphatidyltransferase family protein n=1 Tax=Planctomonas sp. JC2975 TaxID=2729626 RepID=UPI001475B931|nr:CDP-alcohol phosphatidyltransferase family protein [Planctomonas sp. JC2975]NNC13613.1 CDP-alcohol phosphatidyltransferase family protein [Planctomonas sp. JC2975]